MNPDTNQPVHELLLLSAQDVEAVFDHALAEQAVWRAFELLANGDGELLPLLRHKIAENNFFGIKGGLAGKEELLGFKAAGYWPGNHARGLDAHQATMMLVDHATGRPKAILDANRITTLRTGAAGGIGIRLLAREDANVLGLIGTGVQGRIQTEFALRARPGLQQIRYLSQSEQSAAAFEAIFRGRAELVRCDASASVVRHADIVITATPSTAPLFDTTDVREGTHINAVGADSRGKRELPADLLLSATVLTDWLTQARSIGELQWHPELPALEIGEVIVGRRPGRTNDRQITVFDMTGIGMQDLTSADAIWQAARRAGYGKTIPWPAG